jgi:hypothetical protein
MGCLIHHAEAVEKPDLDIAYHLTVPIDWFLTVIYLGKREWFLAVNLGNRVPALQPSCLVYETRLTSCLSLQTFGKLLSLNKFI